MKKSILMLSFTALTTTAYAQNYNNELNATPEVETGLAMDMPNDSFYNDTPMHTQQQKRNWDLTLLAGLGYGSKYQGSEGSELKPIIFANGSYNIDSWQYLYLSYENGLGYGFKLTDNLDIGAGLGYRFGRESDDAAILHGLDDVDDTATVNAFAEYKFTPNYKAGIRVSKGLDSSNKGLTTKLYAGYSSKLTEKFTLNTSISTIYGDDDYMEQNFGVSAADATAKRAAHNADSGFSNVSLTVGGNYNIDGPHNILSSVKYTKLLGDAKDSSITEDDTDVALMMSYAYKF